MGKHKKISKNQPVSVTDDQPWAVWLVRWLSYAALAAVLIADNASPTVSSLSKISIFQLFAGLAVAIWLVLAIKNRAFRPNWRNPLIIGATVFLIAMVPSVFTSVDPYRSFWSNPYRLNGLFNYLHYWLWFLALASTQRGWRDWRPLLWTANGVALIVNGIGISRWILDHSVRITSTIDNALYLADFALLSVFVSALLLARSRNPWARAIAALSLVVHAFATLLTGSRSTAGALLLAAAMFIPWLIISRFKDRYRKIAWVALAVTCLVAVTSLAWLRTNGARPLTERLPQSFQRILLTTDFGGDRAALAQISLKAFHERPVFGWGPEHFEVAFENNYGPIGVDADLPEAWYDRAHNQFLDVLVMTGLVGLLGYLFFWCAAIYLTVHRLVRGQTDHRDADMIGLALVTCYAAALIFSFDLPGPMAWQWLLFAYLASRETEPTTSEPSGKNEPSSAVIIVAVALTLILELVLSVKPYIQARTMENACRISVTNPQSALAGWRSALRSETMATPELRFKLLGCLSAPINSGIDDKIKQEMVFFANSQMDRAVASRSYDYKTILSAGWIKFYVKKFGKDELNFANDYFMSALAINPDKPRAYEMQADLAGIRGEPLVKADLLRQAAELSGDPKAAATYFFRSVSHYANGGEPGQAMVAFERGYALAPAEALNNAAMLSALSEAFSSDMRATPGLIDALDKAVAKYGDAANHANRLRILLTASNVDAATRESAFEETRRAFPELADLFAERLEN